ncbi:hypothetical protein NEA10_07390 [Phormidium yuhuli AB48]|uniref:DUF2281 domain-containing protein n=1 Tax=Phormidium yuhuli AB48 TaxID=2940671 RepID=A0ABY5ATI3_9CYAN|nr:hypothetical protein [Phormidium yuhuli]USR92532.1 hypothetical protein NEA10_07390 [Phormidium yuhuli AB48]
MSKTIIERQDLVEVVNALPDEVLVELANFLDYLRYKTSQDKKTDLGQQNFLLSVAGLGKSGQQDVSERDEEILLNEIDPVYGWSSQSSPLA